MEHAADFLSASIFGVGSRESRPVLQLVGLLAVRPAELAFWLPAVSPALPAAVAEEELPDLV